MSPSPPTSSLDRFTSRILRAGNLAVNYNLNVKVLNLYTADPNDGDQRFEFTRQRNPGGDSQYVI